MQHTLHVETTINEEAESDSERTIQSIYTAADVVQELSDSGTDITYVRIPLSNDRVPSSEQLDALVRLFQQHTGTDTVYIFASVSAELDTTVAAVARELLHRALNPEPEPEPEAEEAEVVEEGEEDAQPGEGEEDAAGSGADGMC